MSILSQTGRTAKSPYARHSKRPYQYMAEVYACIKACKEGKAAEYRANAEAFWNKVRGAELRAAA
jgi:hypothetical protein